MESDRMAGEHPEHQEAVNISGGEKPDLKKPQSLPWKIVRTTLPWIVTIILLYYTFRRVPFGKVIHEMAAINFPLYLLLWLPAEIPLFFLNVYSLKWLVDWFAKPVPFKEFWAPLAATYLLGLVNPLVGLGALFVWLNRRKGSAAFDLGKSLLFLILIDVFVNTAIIGIALAYVPDETLDPSFLKFVKFFRGAVWIGLVYFVYFYFFWIRKWDFKWLGFQRNVAAFQPFNAATPSQYARYALVRFLFAGIATVRQYFMMTLVFDVHIPPASFFGLVPVANLLGFMPVSISGFGSTQVSWLVIFKSFLIEDKLVAMTLTWNASYAVICAAVGILGMAKIVWDLYRKPARRGPEAA